MFEDMISAVQGGGADPEAMKKMMLAQFLMGGGASMANAAAKGGRGSYGRSLAAGMAGGMQATGDVFDVLLKQQMNANQINREDKRRSEDVAWREKQAEREHSLKLSEVQALGDYRAKQMKLAADENASQKQARDSQRRVSALSNLTQIQGEKSKQEYYDWKRKNEPLSMFAGEGGVSGLDTGQSVDALDAMSAADAKSQQASQWADAVLAGKISHGEALQQAPTYDPYLDQKTKAQLAAALAKARAMRGTIER